MTTSELLTTILSIILWVIVVGGVVWLIERRKYNRGRDKAFSDRWIKPIVDEEERRRKR